MSVRNTFLLETYRLQVGRASTAETCRRGDSPSSLQGFVDESCNIPNPFKSKNWGREQLNVPEQAKAQELGV